MREIHEILERLKRIERLLIKGDVIIMADLTKLIEDVNAATTADASIVALVKGIADQLKAAQGDQAKIDALATQLEAGTSSIVDAVKANTPAAP